MKIFENCSLKQYHTFQFDNYAKKIFEINSISDILELYTQNIFVDGNYFILGEGSNVLFTDNYTENIIFVNIKGMRILEEDDLNIYIEVNAGETWSDFVNYLVGNNYYGAENLTDIPGYCGSSVVQNIGAYGVEVGDIVEEIKYFHITEGQIKSISKNDCHFGYRDSIFKNSLKNKVIVLSVIYKLSKIEKFNTNYQALDKELSTRNLSKPTLQDISTIISEIRKSKLPDVKILGNAGSFYKNPIISIENYNLLKTQYNSLISFRIDNEFVKLAAAQLIELCGLKGYRVGNVGVHEKQPLVLVHYGNGTSNEIVDLSNYIIRKVSKQFDIILEPEVIFV